MSDSRNPAGSKPTRDDVAIKWRVRFSLPYGYFTFTDISSPSGAPITREAAWAWGRREVRGSKGRYLSVVSVHSIDHEEQPEF